MIFSKIISLAIDLLFALIKASITIFSDMISFMKYENYFNINVALFFPLIHRVFILFIY